MSFISLLKNPALTGFLITLTIQLTLISAAGTLLLKWLAKRPAPLRSLACSGIMAALLLVFIASIGFQSLGIAWHKSALPSIFTPAPAPLTAAPLPSPLRPQQPRLGLSPRVENSQPLRISYFINGFGLLWAAGFLFALLKLAYGLVFLQGFRFGLAKAADGKFDSLVRYAAGIFRKTRLPEIYTSPKMDSPITMGLLNPIVILPEKLSHTLTETELKSILLHELAHIYHFDHLVGVIKRIVLAAQWWNPLVYKLNAEHDLAREEVSDNCVLRELNPRQYSQCLADLAAKVSLISNLPAAAGMAGRRFSLAKRVESILSDKRSLDMQTGPNLRFMISMICIALAFFIAGVHAQINTPIPSASKTPSISPTAQLEATQLIMAGRTLTPEEAVAQEKVAEQHPDDLAAKTLLLAYYSKQRLDPTYREKAEEIILWLIKNHPEAPVLGNSEAQILPGSPNYGEGAKLWKDLLLKNPNNPHWLWNAGKYFMYNDLDLSIDCLRRGKDLDQENAVSWYRQLGQLYKFKMQRSPAEDYQPLAFESLNAYEGAYAAANPQMRIAILSDVAKAAFEAGALDKAAEYANNMLTTTDGYSFNRGDRIYYGNYVLGMIALQKEDIATAEKYLLEAGETSGSPSLNSFGPNMRLARKLLDRGKRETVLAFLKKCSKFWKSSKNKCTLWIQELEAGETPDISSPNY